MFQPGSVLNKNGMSQTGTILQETDHADKCLKIRMNVINVVHNTENDRNTLILSLAFIEE